MTIHYYQPFIQIVQDNKMTPAHKVVPKKITPFTYSHPKWRQTKKVK